MSDLNDLERLVNDMRQDLAETRIALHETRVILADLVAWKAERSKPIEISIGDAFAKNEIEERTRRAKALVAGALRYP